LSEQKHNWLHIVTSSTPQEEMQRIFKVARLVFKWPDRGWKTELARKIGVNSTIFSDWLNGNRHLRGKTLEKIVWYINEILPNELPRTADTYANAYRKDRIHVADLEDNVDPVFNFIKRTSGAVVVNDSEINHIIGILTLDDINMLRRSISKTSAQISYRVTLKELYFKNKLFSKESKGRSFRVRKREDSIESVLSELNSVEYVIIKDRDEIVSVCYRPPKDIAKDISGPAREHVEEYRSNDFLGRVATKLIGLIPDVKIRKNGLYIDIATGTGAGAKALFSRMLEKFGEQCCTIVAADDANQVSFHGLLSKEIKEKGLRCIELSFQEEGRTDLSRHLQSRLFDIAVWNCIPPTKGALSGLNHILADDGCIAISNYDSEDLEEVFDLIIESFKRRKIYLDMPREEMFTLVGLKDFISSHKDIDRQFKWILHQEELEANFINSRSFINFLHCAFPFSAGCFSLLENMAAKEEILLFLEREVKNKYGSKSIAIPFNMNFIVGLCR
jgi:predicted transcriptional regulator